MDYSLLTDLYESLESTSKRLEKTKLLSDFLRDCPKNEVDKVMLLVQGLVFPKADERKIGVASKLIVKAINIASGIDTTTIEKTWKKTGDLGLTTEELIKKKKQHTLFSEDLTVDKVFKNIQKLASIEGTGSTDVKLKIIAELLTSAKPKEARYIARTVLEDLRVGLGEGTLRDAIAIAYCGEAQIEIKTNPHIQGASEVRRPPLAEKDIKGKSKLVKTETDSETGIVPFTFDNFSNGTVTAEIRDIIQEAYDITNDYAIVARLLLEKGIEELNLKYHTLRSVDLSRYDEFNKILVEAAKEAFKTLKLSTERPVKVMLAQKAKDVKEAFEMVGRPAAIEYKYDGFRMLIGKDGDKITIHTRRLENVTNQFPDVVKVVREHVKTESCIIDGEAVGFDPKTKRYVPFQNISQRIRRKYDIEQLSKEVPVELNIFDILYLNGESTIKNTFQERRKIIKLIITERPQHIRLAVQTITDNDDDADKFYHQSLDAGNEGVMFKSLDTPYKPGSRVGSMVKLKPVMETLDVTIVKAEWGEGKRAGWLTSYTVAIYDEDTNDYLEIGKFGTGIKEKKDELAEGEVADEKIVSFDELTEAIKPNIISEDGREVVIRPSVVVELKFEEIQKSPSCSSGYALRFPRLVRIRADRSPDEASTLRQVEGFYKEQY